MPRKPASPQIVDYLSTLEACRLLKLGRGREARRRLRRWARARAKLLDPPPMLQSAPGSHAPYRWTLPLLRRLFPERFDPADELADSIRAKLDEHLAPMRDQLDAMAAKIRQIEDMTRKRTTALRDAYRALKRERNGPAMANEVQKLPFVQGRRTSG